MISDELIKKQITNTLEKTDFEIGKKYKGKVRDSYILEDKRIIVTTDRISCFDRVVGTVPFKGQILNQIAVFWFDKTKDIAENHILENPDPNVVVVKECQPLPVEMIVRGYITGSLWRDYEKGKRDMYGIKFDDNLKKDQKFDTPIVTPTTKAEYGKHDEAISEEEIIKEGLVSAEIYKEIKETALKLFNAGSDFVKKNNLILVDTKYEFGLLDGKIILMDEMHTPDSSRFWYADSYEELFKAGKSQRMLDKEYVRQWLIERGFMGDGEAPELTEEVKVEAAKKYITLYEQITGSDLEISEKDILSRVTENLKNKRYLQ